MVGELKGSNSGDFSLCGPTDIIAILHMYLYNHLKCNHVKCKNHS